MGARLTNRERGEFIHISVPTYDAYCLVVVTITVIKLRLAKCQLGTN